MKTLLLLAVFSLCLFSPAQSVEVNVKGGGEAYEYVNKPFPTGMKVFDLDKKPHTLKVDQLTLIQVFGLCCGAEPEVWFKVRELEAAYKDRGLKTIAISFDNGSDFSEHLKSMVEFFQKVEKPEHYYMDHMGYVIDDLGVPGFPTYFLVSAEGNVILRVNGKNKEALNILEEEIQTHLPQ